MDQIEGELELVVYDYPDKEVLEHHIKTSKGDRIKIKAPKDIKHGKFRTGQKVKINGHLKKRDQQLDVLEIDGENEIIPTERILPIISSFGVRKTLILIAKFATAPYPTDLIGAQKLADDLNRFYREQSYGKTSIAGIKNPNAAADIFFFDSTANQTSCGSWFIQDEGIRAAMAAGYNTGSYNRFIVIHPGQPCGYAGVAGIGGNTAIANGEATMRVVAHESGHNDGLHHSNSDLGNYGDYTCIMGNQTGDMNIFCREMLGYINTPGQPQVPVISQSGDYAIEALDNQQNLAAIRGIKIVQSTDPITGAKTYLYFSTRIGTWQGSGVRRAVYVHTANDGPTGVASSLWKARVGIDPTEYFDMYLDVGDTWTEPGFTVQTLSLGQTSAILRVTFGGTQSTIPNAPILVSVQAPTSVPNAPVLVSVN